ncbi:unnamed protein product, partial [Rotaria sordida]
PTEEKIQLNELLNDNETVASVHVLDERTTVNDIMELDEPDSNVVLSVHGQTNILDGLEAISEDEEQQPPIQNSILINTEIKTTSKHHSTSKEQLTKTQRNNIRRRAARYNFKHGSMVKLKNEMKQLQEEQQMVLEHKLLEQQHQQQHQPYVLAQKYKTERLRPRSSSPFITPKNDHFTSMDTPRTASQSPLKHGGGARKSRAITIIIDNAPWHREVTDNTKPPLRSWRKQMIADWLHDHDISYAKDISKAELLELAYENLPEKKYKVEEEAKQYQINILCLPMRHCILNPVELAWANMKTHIRERNTKFTLAEVSKLAQEWIHGLSATEATSYINHIKQCEVTFKKADTYVEEIEEEINEHDDDDYSTSSTDDADD